MMIIFASLLRDVYSLSTRSLLTSYHPIQTHKLAFSTSRSYVSFSTSKFSLRSTVTSNQNDKKKTFYITTPIYYVNGDPHLGHAYTSIACDIIARYHRYNAKDVFFLTGTDEHGQKVEQSALTNKQTPIQFADTVSERFKKLSQVLECSNSDFIRTTQERHKKAVHHLWDTFEKNGQIYLGAYEGWYSVRDEAFYAETDLIDGKAPTGAPVEWVKEESYFFKLSQYTEKLLKHYEDNPDFIGPKGRRNEVISFVAQEGGLKDLSISRTTFNWGISVTKDPKHVVYVWLDALTNYLTAVGYPYDETNVASRDNFSKFWPADLHVVGKDILRFHAIFWPAFLMAADLPLPKRIFAHGWWTRDGEKMSKSVGNVIDPFKLIQWYGVDYVRYFLASDIVFGGDGDFTHDAFAARINADLSNDVGNLLQRVLSFIATRYNHIIPAGDPSTFTEEDKAMIEFTDSAIANVHDCLEQQNLKGMCEAIISISKQGNKYIDTQAPWKLHKVDPVRCGTVLYVLAESLRRVGILLQPIMPKSASQLLDQLAIPLNERNFDDTRSIKLKALTTIPDPYPIFPKVDIASMVPPDELKKTGTTSSSDSKENQNTVIALDNINTMSIEEVNQKINEIGDQIRDMKKNKINKNELKPYVDTLLLLKTKLQELSTGSVPSK